MQEKLPQLKISEKIREINFQGLRIGGDASVPFMQENDSTSKPLLALELPFFYEENFPLILKKQYGENYEITDAVKKAESLPNDLLSIRFNIREDQIDKDFAEINDKLDEIFERLNRVLDTKMIIMMECHWNALLKTFTTMRKCIMLSEMKRHITFRIHFVSKVYKGK